jgi:hypothetical protein
MLLASEFDQSRFFRAEGYEQDKKFRIKAVAPEPFEERGETVMKLVVWFTNDKKGLILNKTNLRTLKGAFGDDTSNWVNKVIVIYPMMAELRGKMVPALRVRIPPPKQAAAAPQQPVTSGNGANAPAPAGSGAAAAAAAPVAAAAPLVAAALATAALAVVDPELEPDPVKPIREELDDDIVF